MLRILRAFAWMRWRIFINSLEKTGARDAVERFSLAIEHVGPVLLVAMMVPSALALAGLAGYAGYELGSGVDGAIAVQVVRYILLAATALAIVGPMMLPIADRTNPVRLLLLPIPRRTLYVAQAAGALTDPWIMLLVPMVFALPIGMLIGGAPAAMLAALAAGILVVLAVVAVSALTTTLIHLLLRDRRRGELVALAVVMVLPLISLVPAAIGSRHERRSDRARSVQQDPEQPQPERRRNPLPPWAARAGTRALSLLPSEQYTSAIVRAGQGDVSSAAVAATALAMTTAGLHGIGLLLFGRVLAAPLTSGARRKAAVIGVWRRALPGLSPGASAVALAHMRLALRTPRGRAILFSPLLMFVFFGFLTLKAGDMSFGPLPATGGIGLAVFASAASLLSSLPIAMNQFAVDGPGLTMALLSPLSTRQILAGKAVGNGLVAISTALLCVAIAAVVFRGGSLAAWCSLVLSLVATYTLTAPAAAVFSALLPRVVDMNSIGRGSNAHGLSGLLGLLALGVAAAPCIAILFAARLLWQPAAAPFLLLVWCALSFVAARLLFIPVARVFDKRRENLAMLM